MSKFKRLIVIFALVTGIIVGNCAAMAEDIDTGKYNLALEYTSYEQGQAIKTLGIQEVSRTSVTVDISGSKTSFEKPYISLRGPKAFIKSLEVNDIPSNSAYTSRIVQEGENLCLQLIFDKLQGGDKFSFFVKSKYREYLTPDQQKVPLQAELLKADGQSLIKSNSLIYTIQVNKPIFTKSVDSPQQAGEDENGYVKSDTAQSIPFNFAFSGETFGLDIDRAINNGKITDILPTYTDNAGKSRVAEVDTEKSKGWQISNDKNTAFYEIKATRWNIYGYTSYYDLKVPPLYLKFPQAKFNTAILNKATYQLVPTAKQAGEKDYTGQSSCEVVLVPSVAEKPVELELHKYSDKTEIQDTLAEKEKEQEWSVRYSLDKELQNVVIEEETDKRLYITSLKEGGYDGFKFIPNIAKVEGLLANGNWEKTEKEASGFWGFFGNSDEYKIKNASKYQAIRITFKKLAANPGQFFGPSLKIKTRFREPNKIKAQADETLNNYQNTVRIKNVQGVEKEATAQFKLVPFSAPFNFSISSDQDGKTISNGEFVQATIKLGNTVPENDKTGKRRVVVIIPDGLEYAGSIPFQTEINPWSHKIVNKEIVADYHNSGKRAIIYDLNDCVKTNVGFDDNTEIRMRFKVKDLYSRKQIELRAYYSFDGVQTAKWENSGIFPTDYTDKKVADKYDINDNSQRDDLVAKVTVNFNPDLTRGLWARTLIGRTEEGLSPYSIALKAGEPSILALSLNNSLTTPQKGLVMYATLPTKNDKTIMPNQAGVYSQRGSTADLQLTGAINAPDGYDVYYLTENPPEKAEDALNSASWTKTVADWSTVKAFKLVAQAQTELAVNAELLVTVPVKTAQATANDVAVASFAYKVAAQPNLVEANTVRLIMPREYTLQKIWRGETWYNKVKANYDHAKQLPSVDIAVRDNNGKLVKTVTLTAADNWQQKVELPAYIGTEIAEYTFAEEKLTAEGFDLATSKVDVKDAKVEITNTLHLKAVISKKFTRAKDTLKIDQTPAVTLILQQGHVGQNDFKEYQKFTVPQGQENFSQEVVLPVADEQGELTYRLTESPLAEGWESHNDGQLKLDDATPFKGTLSLTNIWTKKAQPITYEIKGYKFLKADKTTANLPDITGKYRFTLNGAQGAPMPENKVVTNQKDGSISFPAITFKLSDLAGVKSKVFNYTVTESGTLQDIKNDEHNEKPIALTLSLQDDGTLSVEATADVSAKEATQAGLFSFINVYQEKTQDPVPPVPADPNPNPLTPDNNSNPPAPTPVPPVPADPNPMPQLQVPSTPELKPENPAGDRKNLKQQVLALPQTGNLSSLGMGIWALGFSIAGFAIIRKKKAVA